MSNQYWGSIYSADQGTPVNNISYWAADCGAYTGAFKWGRYIAWLKRMLLVNHLNPPLFAVVPDSVFNAIETLYMYKHYSIDMGMLGINMAYVIQDGAEHYPIPDTAGAIFIGGTKEYKYSLAVKRIIKIAQNRGLWIHVGRINSRKAIRYFRKLGINSVDGTTIVYAPKKRIADLEIELRQTSYLS